MQVEGDTAEELYQNLWWRIKVGGRKEHTRNGPVLTIPEPVIATLHNPRARHISLPVRNSNPFFHIAEVVWMYAGSDDVLFIEKFNKRYREYAEVNGKVWGAYGHRWINHFGINQIQAAINTLKRDRTTRQAVINMWDPRCDLVEVPLKDRPCNTQIMFRMVEDQLNMTVINRSNDLVWGMMGANVVHFTYLQELIAHQTRVELGVYRVVTNNIHVYTGMPNYEAIKDEALTVNLSGPVEHIPGKRLLQPDETWEMLQEDCEAIVDGVAGSHFTESVRTYWASSVAVPYLKAFLARRNRIEILMNCEDLELVQLGSDWLIKNAKEKTL